MATPWCNLLRHKACWDFPFPPPPDKIIPLLVIDKYRYPHDFKALMSPLNLLNPSININNLQCLWSQFCNTPYGNLAISSYVFREEPAQKSCRVLTQIFFISFDREKIPRLLVLILCQGKCLVRSVLLAVSSGHPD